MRARTTRSARSVLFALLLAAFSAQGDAARAAELARPAASVDTRPVVVRVGYSVDDLERVVDFYRTVLDFEWVEAEQWNRIPVAPDRSGADRARFVRLRLGDETIELARYTPPGRPIPESRSNDLWFQHLAIVVSDIDAAAQRLRAHGARAVSVGGPQTIPLSNPAAGGIRAFYFRDPEDLWHWEIAMRVAQRPRVVERARQQRALWAEPEPGEPVLVRDPDGHVVRLLEGSP